MPQRLRELADEQSVTREALSALTGRSPRAVADWFDGHTTPTNDAVEQLAALFGTSYDYLTTGVGAKRRRPRSEVIVDEGGNLFAVAVRSMAPDSDGRLREAFVRSLFAERIKAGTAHLDPFLYPPAD